MRELGVLATIPRARGRESSTGAHGRNGGAHSRAWRTRGHSVEHVAGDGVGAVGTKFSSYGLIWTLGLKQSLLYS